jgi:hypothetical protein
MCGRAIVAAILWVLRNGSGRHDHQDLAEIHDSSRGGFRGQEGRMTSVFEAKWSSTFSFLPVLTVRC